MDDPDLQIRNYVYRHFVGMQRAPGVNDLRRELGLSTSEADAALRRLHDAHALVLERDRSEIRMLNPFSCVPTAHRVQAAGRWWYANCGWDAFGIPATLGVDAHIASSCPDCSEPIEIDVWGGRPVPDEHIFHVLVPAVRWWDDIVFT